MKKANTIYIYLFLQALCILLPSFCYLIIERNQNSTETLSGAETFSFRALKRFGGTYENLKYQLRGERAPQSKIVILGIDEASLAKFGRWPWPRKQIADNLEKILSYEPKLIALDMVFAEKDEALPRGLKSILDQKKMGFLIDFYDGDKKLAEVFKENRDKVVLGYTSEFDCRPSVQGLEACPIDHSPEASTIPGSLSEINPSTSAIVYSSRPIRNLPELEASTAAAGFFNSWPDSDSFIRRQSLVMNVEGRLYPSLSLASAALASGKKISLELDPKGNISQLKLGDSILPTNSRGDLSINVSGSAFAIPQIAFWELWEGELEDRLKKELKDAIVFVGLTAMGLQDVRSFPTDSQMPGVEGHAWATDSFLSGNTLRSETNLEMILVVSVMLILGMFLAFALRNSEPLLALSLPFAFSLGIFALDYFLFIKGLNFYLLFAGIQPVLIGTTLAAHRFREEARERAYVRNAFGHYLSGGVVNWILENPDSLKLGGRKKNLSIMFTDIRNFTSFSETVAPDQLTNFLNDYMNLMTNLIVEKYSGTLDKYIGDAIMAFWGAPQESPSHAVDSVRCAKAMIESLQSARAQLFEKYKFDVQIGVGINSGEVTVGNMGSEKNFNYTVIGDAVNLASRVEGLSKQYGAEILISESTRQLLGKGHELQLRIIDRVRVKGKKEAVSLYQVFAGKSPEPKWIENFESAYKLYIERQFEKALMAFQDSSDSYRKKFEKDDKCSLLYIERCKTFMAQAPQKDWDGSTTATEK